MKKAVFAAVVFALSAVSVQAAERVESLDEDKDGRAETQMFYDDYGRVKSESDMNADGKPDRFLRFKNGKRFAAEEDKDFDGTIDRWITFDGEGVRDVVGSDTNDDGKPDRFNKQLKPGLVLREQDRNHDGKIDSRGLSEWKEIRYGPGIPPVPGYVTVWKEEDNDFDGVIDAYREKGNKDAAKLKVGKPMQQAPTTNKDLKKKEEPAAKGGSGNSAEEKIRRMNEQHGFD